MGKNNLLRYQGTPIQIPPDHHRFHSVTVPARVHEYPDGTVAMSPGPRCIVHNHAVDRLVETGEAPNRVESAPQQLPHVLKDGADGDGCRGFACVTPK